MKGKGRVFLLQKIEERKGVFLGGLGRRLETTFFGARIVCGNDRLAPTKVFLDAWESPPAGGVEGRARSRAKVKGEGQGKRTRADFYF